MKSLWDKRLPPVHKDSVLIAVEFNSPVNVLHPKKTCPTQTELHSHGLKFWIQKEEGLYYLCSENKDADQLRGYRVADLLLCFCICKKNRFSYDASQITR